MHLKPLTELEQAQEQAFLRARQEGKSYTEALRIAKRAARVWREALKLAERS